jgi:hypothetical protein
MRLDDQPSQWIAEQRSATRSLVRCVSIIKSQSFTLRQPAVNKTVVASQAAVEDFLKHLDSAGFWSLPAQKPPDIHHVPMGEAGWMLEAIKGGSYHLVHRGDSELGSLKKALAFLVVSTGYVDLQSLQIDPARR